MSQRDNEWFEAAWAQREETIYRALFGDLGGGIYPLDLEVFGKVFNCMQVDPRWLHVGVFASPPNGKRNSWVYVTSGLSNAWDVTEPDPNDWSGLGTELLLQTAEESHWALLLARKLAAYQLLLSVQHFGDHDLLEFGDRTPAQGPINGAESELESLLIVASPRFGGKMQLLSGQFEFLQFVGITRLELAYAKEHSSAALHEKLLATGASPVIDPKRKSIL